MTANDDSWHYRRVALEAEDFALTEADAEYQTCICGGGHYFPDFWAVADSTGQLRPEFNDSATDEMFNVCIACGRAYSYRDMSRADKEGDIIPCLVRFDTADPSFRADYRQYELLIFGDGTDL